MICPDCDGEGGHDDANTCSYACDSCGGCFDEEPCEACEATGEIDDNG